MNFIEWMQKTSPEDLQKLAEEAQDDLVRKVMDSMIPLFEKQAQYTVHLIKLAMEDGSPAEEEQEQKEPVQQEEESAEQGSDPIPGALTPLSGGKDNTDVVGSETPEGLKATEVSEAVDQAVAAGQPDKIMPFVKAVAQAHPDALNEIVKIVKVCIHDAVMKRTIDPEQAAKIAEELNAIVAGPSEAGA